jgi:hypothetical protein
MNNTYRIYHHGHDRGCYTVEQLRSMWLSGNLPADTLYRQDGMTSWAPLQQLHLDTAIPSGTAQHVTMPGQKTRLPSLNVYHTGKVATKAHSSGIVAVGAVMCIIGVFIVFANPSIGRLLILVGFLVAVTGRLMSWSGKGMNPKRRS